MGFNSDYQEAREFVYVFTTHLGPQPAETI